MTSDMGDFIDADFVNENTRDGYQTDTVEKSVEQTNQLVSRAFAELYEKEVIDRRQDYTEETLKYVDSSGDNVAKSIYAMFDSVAYISWLWVSEPLRSNGAGKFLLKNIIIRIESNGIEEIYVLPKSAAANHIFTSMDFKDATELSGTWKVRKT